MAPSPTSESISVVCAPMVRALADVVAPRRTQPGSITVSLPIVTSASM